MKKHLIAAAVAAAVAAPAAYAQVTVYGVIDAGYVTSSTDHGVNQTKQKAIGGIDSANGTGTLSGSRLGFRGTEDLGGGLKAGFVLETGVRYSNGIAANGTPAANAASVGANAALFGNTRQAFLELSGSFGGIRIGTQNTLAKDSTESIDPLAGVTITGAASIYQAGLVTRRDTITYATPTFNGISGRAQIYIGENTTGGAVAEENKGNAISVNYSGGPIRVAAISETIKAQTYAARTATAAGNTLVNTSSNQVLLFGDAVLGAATTIDKLKYNAVGASYNFGPASLHALTTSLKIEDETAANRGKVESTLVGVGIPLGQFSIRGSITTGKIKRENANAYDLDGYQLVGQYDLSKRTNAYIAMGQTEYDSPTANNDVKVKQMGVGIRHSF
jgi:predicted porin